MNTDTNPSPKSATTALPSDPENMNDTRAAWAGAALRQFQQETGTDDEDALTDLLCDLMHWSDRNGGDFFRALIAAQRLYDAEITPPQSEPHHASRHETATVQTPYWRQCIQAFIALEIHPHMVMRGSSCGSYLEPCDLEKAEVWTVIGCYPAGGNEPCEDFATEAKARHFRDGLVSRYPHLGASETIKS